MSRSRVSPSLSRVLPLLCLLAVAVTAGAPLPAQPVGVFRPVATRAAAFRDSWAAMRRRDLQFAAEVAAGLRAPRPLFRVMPSLRKPRFLLESAPDTGLLFAAPQGRAAQTVGTRFPGISLNDQIADFSTISIPPDTQAAVGPNHVVEVVNGSVAIFTRSGTRLSHVTLESFFAVTAGGISYPRNGAFDPRVIFDHRSGRWMATVVEFGNPAQTNNHVILAISDSSDPTGSYRKFVLPFGVPTSGSTTFFTDHATLGTDDNGVYSAAAIFGSEPSFRNKIVAIPKSQALTGSTITVFQFDGITGMYPVPQPPRSLGPAVSSDTAWFVGSSPTALANVRLLPLTWSAGTPSLGSVVELSTPAFADPRDLDAPSSGASIPIDTADMRMQEAVVRMPYLWTCRTVGVNGSGGAAGADRTGCEWFQIYVGGMVPNVEQTGRVFDAATTDPRFYYYPSIMVNGQGHVAMGFSGSRSTEFVGAYACGRLATDAAGTMRSVLLLKAGEGPYQLTLGGTRNRWGDYSATSLDPLDDMSVWTAQEYARTPTATPPDDMTSRWGTWIAQIRAPAPTLQNPGASGAPGQSDVTFALHGTGFYDPGPGFPNRLRVTFTGGATNGISGVTVRFDSATQVTVTLDIAANASPGPRDITLTNPDGQSATVTGGFTVGDLLPAPSNLTATVISSSEIRLNWKDNSTTETGFLIQRKQGTSSFSDRATVGANVTTFTDSGLPAGTTFTYRVRAFNSTQTSAFSNEVTATTASGGTPPAAPTGLTATLLTGLKIRLSWTDNSTNEGGFKVERQTAGGAFTLIATLGRNVVGYTNSGLAAGTTYTYRVFAFNSAGNSDFSNSASATTPTLPAAPSGLRATALSGTQVRLNWTDNSDNETGFKVERKTGTTAFAVIGSPGANTTSFVNSGLTPGTTYTYRVRAVNSAGSSPSSNLANVTPPLPPAPPSALAATALSATRVKLVWTDNSTNESGFKIERSQGGGAFAQVGQVGANITTFTHTGLAAGTSYSYRVRAFNVGGHSDYSNVANVTTPTLPAAPSGLSAVAQTAARIALAWTDNSDNEDGFKVERKVSGGDFAVIKVLPANTTSFLNTGLTASTTYTYRVRAYNAAGVSAASNTATATTLSAFRAPEGGRRLAVEDAAGGAPLRPGGPAWAVVSRRRPPGC